MILPKRPRETLEILKKYPDQYVSLNMIAGHDFALCYTFRNGVAELRKFGYVIEYKAKEKGYKLLGKDFEQMRLLKWQKFTLEKKKIPLLSKME